MLKTTLSFTTLNSAAAGVIVRGPIGEMLCLLENTARLKFREAGFETDSFVRSDGSAPPDQPQQIGFS